MIVDDNAGNLVFLEHIIRNLKVNLIQALSGKEALEKTLGSELALAIIDVQMPEMTGYELAQKMNQERPGENVPVIFITASHINEMDALKGYDHGAVDYIFKPFNFRVLQSKINIFIELYLQKQKIKSDAMLLKESASELTRVNSILTEAQQIAHIGSWEWNMITNEVKWSKEMFCVFDIDPSFYDGSPESLLKVLHPDDIGIFNSSMKNNLSDGNSPALEYRVIHRDGSVHYIFAKGKFEFNDKGQPIRGTGTVQDITERKISEEFLKENESRLNRTQAIAHLGSWELDLQTNQLKWSDEAFRIFGLNPKSDTITHDAFLKAIHPEDSDLVNTAYANSVAEGKDTYEIEHRIIRWSTGEIRHVYEKCEHIKDDTGQIIRSVGMVLDITDRKLAEDELRKSENHFRSLFDNMLNGYAYCQMLYEDGCPHDFVYLLVNNSFESLTGLKNVVGKKVSEIVPGISESDPELIKTYGRVAQTGIPEVFEIYIEQLNMWLSIAAYSPKTNYFVAVFEVITERRLAEEALRKSEELFKTVVNNSLDLTTISDSQGIITFVSPQCENVIGYKGDSFIGKHIPDIIHPEDAERCRQVWEKVFADDYEVREYEYRIIDSQGGTRWVSHSAKLIKIDGKVIGMQNTISNITERKKAEEAIKVSEEKYRTMLNASPDGILIVNMKGVITEVSEIALELFGADIRDDLVNKYFFRFTPPDEKNTIKEIIERTLNDGLAQNIEIKIRKKNSSLFAGETSSTLIQGPDGTPVAFMVIIRDISQRKKMETKQLHADRMANLGQMAAGIAHEINQPLNIISLVMDKILFDAARVDKIDLEFLKRKSDKIFENITRMRNIIDHIRAFSRSHDDFVLTAFDVNASIDNALSMIREQFKHLGINLDVHFGRQIPQILGNTYKFEQVILNLLANAKDALIDKKSNEDDFSEMIIEVRSYLEGHFLIVEVTDNGVGISNDDIQHIILPFYTTKEEGKGTGLGLTICYQIIKEMGGTIEIISDDLHGTKIKLLLETQKKF